MIERQENWFPGSFTKNFSWGTHSGLKRLYDAIHICFEGGLEPVPRALAVDRLERSGFIWHIPLNFFLLNQIRDGESLLIADELIYQALKFEHSDRFDKIALMAFLNSYVGRWVGAEYWQAWPAPWARQFVLDQVNKENGWNSTSINANSIEKYIMGSGKYQAQDARKLSTNLNFLWKISMLEEVATTNTIERWWVDSAFLILDRSFAETGFKLSSLTAAQLALQSDFLQFSGPRSKNRELSIRPLADLYWACGGIDRWSQESVQARQAELLPDVHYLANRDDPFFAIYDRDPNIIKTIPRFCAMLAKNLSDFGEISEEELINWDPYKYIKSKTEQALKGLKSKGISPNISAEELLRLTRDK